MNFSEKFGTHKNTVFISLIGGLLLIAVLLTILPANAREVQQEPSAAPDGLTAVEWDGIQSQIMTSASITQQIKLTADDATVDNQFGHSVAIDGDTAVIGAYQDDEGNIIGSAYVFTRSGGSWSQQAKLIAGDAPDAGFLGRSLSVDVHGDTVVIGAYGDDDDGSSSGSVYVFTRNGSSWSQQAKLTADDAAAFDHFGISVAVNGDTAVIGAVGDGGYSGSAYIFTRSSITWSQQAKLTADDATVSDYFGISVAVNGDTAVIGAWFDEDNGSDSGSAYVFTRNGSSWSQQTKLTADDAAAGDYFGRSVAVHGDTAVIGAAGSYDSGINSGAAYVFTRSVGSWSQQAKLTTADGTEYDFFGKSVAVYGDTAVIGAYGDSDGGINSGAAYLFTRSGTTWSQQAKLTAGDAAAGDFFGWSVAIHGNTTVIGAYYNNTVGATYIFGPPIPTTNTFLPVVVK